MDRETNPEGYYAGAVYHGAIQLLLEPTGHRMVGKSGWVRTRLRPEYRALDARAHLQRRGQRSNGPVQQTTGTGQRLMRTIPAPGISLMPGADDTGRPAGQAEGLCKCGNPRTVPARPMTRIGTGS